MELNLRFLSVLVIISISELCYLPPVSGFGSKTYETTDGFPVTFLRDIVNNDIVAKKLNSRWQWEVWDVVPGTHAYQIYVFNITNPDAVEKGEKPVLKQVGPYYYREYRYKFDVAINLELAVNYQRNFTYTFDPKLSKGSEDDTVNIINLPLLVFSQIAAKYNKSEANQAVTNLISSGESLTKKNVKIGDLLFGGIDVSKYVKYLQLMGPSTPITKEFQEGRYGLFKLKNGAYEGPLTVNSGLVKEKKVGSIITYNGRPTLDYWNGEFCNKLEGTDGSVFQPQLRISDKISMFEVDMCRSISFEYLTQKPFKTVTGNMYVISSNLLEDPSVEPQNSCFCNKNSETDACLKKGVLDVSNCQYGAPYVMSYAHFFNASPDYQQGVLGLSPDPAVHQTQLTIEPITGSVMSFHKRYQWNIWVKPIPGIDYFKKFPSMIVPILWNDDVFALDPDKEELLMEELAGRAGGGGSGSDSTWAKFNFQKVCSCALLIFSAKLIFG